MRLNLEVPLYSHIQNDCLHLSGSYLNIAQIEALCTQITKSDLNTLILDNCGLEDEGVAKMILAASKPAKLEKLTLQNLKIGAKTIKAMTCLVQQCIFVEQVRLVNVRATAEHLKEFMGILSSLINLELFELVSMDLKDFTLAESIITLFQAEPKMKQLKISGCMLMPRQLCAIVEGVAEHLPQLVSLNVSTNSIFVNERGVEWEETIAYRFS